MYVKVVHYDPDGTPHNESLYECKTVHFPAGKESVIIETETPAVSIVDGSVKGQEIVDLSDIPARFEARIFVMNGDGKTIDTHRISG